MRGSVHKRCTQCPARTQLASGDRRCPTCGADTFTWYYTVDVGKDPRRGRRHRKRGGFDTKVAAERALREVLAKVDRQRFVEPSKLTVGDFLVDEWLPGAKLSIGPTTWQGYNNYVHAYILLRIGEVPLRELRAPALNALYADLRDKGRVKRQGGLSLKTVRKAVSSRESHTATPRNP